MTEVETREKHRQISMLRAVALKLFGLRTYLLLKITKELKGLLFM